MGDRAYTTIHIHRHYYNQFLRQAADIDTLKNTWYLDEVEEDGDLVKLICYEANYGNIPPLEKDLQENRIEYDKAWEAGSDYEAGEQFYRIIKGKYQTIERNRTQEAILEKLKGLAALPEKEILKHIKKEIKVLAPWDPKPLTAPNSIEYFKKEEICKE